MPRPSPVALAAVAMLAAVALPAPASAIPACPEQIVLAGGTTTLAVPGCDLTGVPLVFGTGGVQVPPRGRFVVYGATAAPGAAAVSVVARHLPDGLVEVDASDTGATGSAGTASVSGDNGCHDGYVVPTDGTALLTPVPWTLSLVNHHGLPPAQFWGDDVVSNYWTSVYLAGTYLRGGHNDCGFRENRFTFAAAVLPGGYSTAQTQIGLDGFCHSTGDERSTVQVAGLHAPAYAVSCHWGVIAPRADPTTEVDIRINEADEFSTDPTVTGSADPDLLGILVHEWGHAYGLRHAPPGHPYLTMNSDLTFPGAWLRTLGLGDYRAMLGQYEGDISPRVSGCPVSC